MAEAPELAGVRPGDELDWGALEAHLRAEVGDLPDVPMRVLQFPRGHANLTYQLAFGDQLMVLRRPPFGKTAPGAHDMGREYRILSRLWQAYPRAPRAFTYSEDEAIIGAPFAVQQYRPGGVVFFSELPEGMTGVADVGERLAAAMADALADLHKVDFAAIGLGDFGKPDGFIGRQMKGWRDRWRRVADVQPVPEMEVLADRLEGGVPAPMLAAIIHNDFKLDNCQFRPTDPDEVIALFDWDMATLGDPLVDVGITLDYWKHIRATTGIPLPSAQLFAKLYAERMGIDVDALRWYEAFAAWRSAVTVQQLFGRYVQGHSHDERLSKAGPLVGVFAARGLAALDGR